MQLVWEQYPEPVMIDLGKSQFGDEGGGGRGVSWGPGWMCRSRQQKADGDTYLCCSTYQVAILSQFIMYLYLYKLEQSEFGKNVPLTEYYSIFVPFQFTLC